MDGVAPVRAGVDDIDPAAAKSDFLDLVVETIVGRGDVLPDGGADVLAGDGGADVLAGDKGVGR